MQDRELNPISTSLEPVARAALRDLAQKARNLADHYKDRTFRMMALQARILSESPLLKLSDVSQALTSLDCWSDDLEIWIKVVAPDVEELGDVIEVIQDECMGTCSEAAQLVIARLQDARGRVEDDEERSEDDAAFTRFGLPVVQAIEACVDALGSYAEELILFSRAEDPNERERVRYESAASTVRELADKHLGDAEEHRLEALCVEAWLREHAASVGGGSQ